MSIPLQLHFLEEECQDTKMLLPLPISWLFSLTSAYSSTSATSLSSALTFTATAFALTRGQAEVFEQLVPFLPVGGNSAVGSHVSLLWI